MQAIYIPHLLQRPQQTEAHQVDEFIAGLETLTPLRGILSIRHGGTFLEVKLQAETIVTLLCDRCVQNYNHRLALDTHELIWLNKEEQDQEIFAKEREVAWEDLTESLPPEGHFDADEWLFEQVSLALPLRKLCGKGCQPPDLPQDDRESQPDGRWATLASLKNQLPS